MREMVHPKLSEEDKELIRELRENGLSQNKIAETFDVAKATIQRWTSKEYRQGESKRQRLRNQLRRKPKWKRVLKKLSEILEILSRC